MKWGIGGAERSRARREVGVGRAREMLENFTEIPLESGQRFEVTLRGPIRRGWA